MKKKYIIGGISVLVIFSLAAGARGFYKYGTNECRNGDNRMTRMFNKIDDNSDDFINTQEYQTMVDKMSRRLDDNEDGMISYDELPKKKNKRRMAYIHSFLDLPTTANNKPVNIKNAMDNAFKRVDADNDNKLSKQEVINAAKNNAFSMFDSNEDGTISKEEFFNKNASQYK